MAWDDRHGQQAMISKDEEKALRQRIHELEKNWFALVAENETLRFMLEEYEKGVDKNPPSG